ncbi:ABC transporter ATP-binding protein [Halobacterium sp. KA-6]|uniref:ABC transporter ATP-binding protein n=1 Tax=Halobacterium sp. KA-6 TaxID=2896368 RepID=UPI001E520889|nr:ABC transporter ATP-binding protein [Halobacterium sp. KA-6]MCD2203297.1 ABC transporter ATP-binding protein [Halobacterium sp. KA-6]
MTEQNARDTDEPTLAFTDASYAFGDVTVLKEASVELQSGNFTALVGPNGSGKTTLLELFAGLRSLDTGTVTRPTASGRTVAYLPQTPGFRSGFTVRETLGFYTDLVEDSADPDSLLGEVGLNDAAGRGVDELSGGMTRLLGIAQALIGDPPVVILDEPTSGLDPDVADHIFDVIESVASDGRLVVTASHDLAAIETRADRALFLSNGEFVLDDDPKRILEATDTETLREAFATVFRTETSGVTRPGANGGER